MPTGRKRARAIFVVKLLVIHLVTVMYGKVKLLSSKVMNPSITCMRVSVNLGFREGPVISTYKYTQIGNVFNRSQK